MAKTLDVYLNRHLCGYLVQDAHGQMRFQYAQAWLGNPNAVPLSHSLPLREERFSSRECRGFFGGILPEASNREVIAHNLGISPRNDFAMLEQIGGECAGAVMFLPSGVTLPERDDRYRNLGFALLREISAAPVIDLQRLLDAVIFNFLIGNRDAHGKNFSILYDEKTSTRRLAPLYDLLSTSFYPGLSTKMAMKIGGEYAPDRIRPQHFDRLAEDAGLAKPLVKRRVQALDEMVLAKIPGVAAGHSKMSEFGDFIQGRITRLRATLLQQQ